MQKLTDGTDIASADRLADLPLENVTGRTKRVLAFNLGIDRVRRRHRNRDALQILNAGCGSGYAVPRFLESPTTDGDKFNIIRLLITVPNGCGSFELESALARLPVLGKALLKATDCFIAMLNKVGPLKGDWMSAAARADGPAVQSGIRPRPILHAVAPLQATP